MKRSAFSLVELMTVMPLLLVIGAATDMLLPAMLQDTPRIEQAVRLAGAVQRAMEGLRRDVDAADALPASFAGRDAGEGVLLLKIGPDVICYEFDGRELRRRTLSAVGVQTQPEGDPGARTWALPRAKIVFRPWPADGPARAVEVRTAVSMNIEHQTYDRLAESRLLFLHALTGGGTAP